MHLLTSSTVVVLWTLYTVNGFLTHNNQTDLEGRDVRLKCTRTQYVDQPVDWKYIKAPGIQELYIYEHGHLIREPRHKYELNDIDYTLTILNVTTHDTGEYHCIENSGLEGSHVINLQVCKVRLSNGDDPKKGRLEIFYHNTWGTVCSKNFGAVDARVACNSLGYSAGGQAMYIEYGPGNKSMPIWLDDVGCSGSESFIGHCRHKGWNVTECDHHQDVSIDCFAPQSEWVRLGGSVVANEGRLEIFHDDAWGTVCSNHFEDVDASVACRSLGYSGGLTLESMYGPGNNSMLIWLDDVGCNGSESFMGDCRHRGWAVHNCDHQQDVSIACFGTHREWVRLGEIVYLEDRVEGRLEIFHDDAWGTVCSDYFDNVDASVACESLGYRYGKTTDNKNMYGPGSSSMPIWLDDVNCSGSESFVGDCRHRGWSVHNCDHQQDVSIACFTDHLDHGTIIGRTILAMIAFIVAVGGVTVLVFIVCKKQKGETPVKAKDTGDHPTDTRRKEENVECHLMSTASH